MLSTLLKIDTQTFFFKFDLLLMQNYIVKNYTQVHISYFFLLKTNQEPRKTIFNFYFYKTYQRHNLLVKLSKWAWTYVILICFVWKCRSYLFSLQISIIPQM